MGNMKKHDDRGIPWTWLIGCDRIVTGVLHCFWYIMVYPHLSSCHPTNRPCHLCSLEHDFLGLCWLEEWSQFLHHPEEHVRLVARQCMLGNPDDSPLVRAVRSMKHGTCIRHFWSLLCKMLEGFLNISISFYFYNDMSATLERFYIHYTPFLNLIRFASRKIHSYALWNWGLPGKAPETGWWWTYVRWWPAVAIMICRSPKWGGYLNGWMDGIS